MTSRWTEQKERGSGVMLWLLVWLAVRLGRRLIRWLLYPITAYFILTGHAARKASHDYLARIFGSEPGWRELFRHFYAFAVVASDRIFLLSGRMGGFQIEQHNADVITRHVDRHRGCILLVSHLGSFDVMRVLATRERGLPIRIVLDRHHNARALALLERLDPELAAGIIDARQPGHTLVLAVEQCLREGGLVGIMADRAGPDERVYHCNFLGQPAAFPLGAWQLAQVLKVPIVLCVGLYLGGNRYSLHFEQLMEAQAVPRRERRLVIERAMEHYAARLEFYCRLAPFNWFNFYDFWHDEQTSDH